MAESQRRRSIFHETGLNEPELVTSPGATGRDRPLGVRFRSRDEVHVIEQAQDGEVNKTEKIRRNEHIDDLSNSSLRGKNGNIMYRFGAVSLLLAAIVPLLRNTAFFSHGAALPIQPVEGGVIPEVARSRSTPDLVRRADSPTDVCIRWSGQSALVNGTLYYYGGEASTQSGQTQDTWNNDLIAFDLTKTWQIASPSVSGLPQPSGPPAVALGVLWNSYDSLYLYGGEYSWQPITTPSPLALWEYDIQGQSWIEHSNPTTSNGQNAPSNEVPVQDAAEGAGVSVPSLGRGFYFGGHQDSYTTPGWPNYIYRIYLQSLLEFTFPGYSNNQVDALANGKIAGSDGNYRNITEGGLQTDAGFTKRADGLLIYVPGFGDQGILLALAGGTNTTFTQMNIINVYDIATSTWYDQSTSGPSPTIRVNPCAVIAAAPDGSSYNIYMFGGQNLTPYGNQSQFDDMWILTLPSFTWIEVDQSGQSVPAGRSGQTCNIWDGQMVMVGGYVGDELSCDSPGVYVFDLSDTQWVQQFTALSPGPSSGGSSSSGSDSSATASASGSSSTGSSSDFNSTGANNPLNQQPAQIAKGSSPGGLEGSYGYTVPEIVIKVIGGSPSGGATVTAPVVTATGGPLATGKPITYTVTQSNGATVTETAGSSSGNNGGSGTNGGNNGTSSSDTGHNGPNIAAIVVGVICGILFIIVCYLSFCAYVYRKQLRLYKRHVEMSQAQARGEKVPAIPGLLATDSSAKTSSDRGPNGNALFGTDSASQSGSGAARSGYSGGQTSSSGPGIVGGNGYTTLRRDSDRSSVEDLMSSHEPTFVGVMLNPRRSLKVINRD